MLGHDHNIGGGKSGRQEKPSSLFSYRQLLLVNEQIMSQPRFERIHVRAVKSVKS